MVTNDFLPFATGGGANVESQGSYAADGQLAIGSQPGLARSSFVNKTLRQASSIASAMAQLAANATGANASDNGVAANLLSLFMAALNPLPPNITKHTAGSGTFNLQYQFFCASGNATSGATYTNNAVTFTVVNTISAGLLLQATGNGDPTIGGTLTKASGTGDATITFYAFRKATYLRAIAVGPGGGGAAGSGSGGSPGNGQPGSAATTLGAIISAGLGSAGLTGGTSAGGAGGINTISSPAVAILDVPGGKGEPANIAVTNGCAPGGAGGANPLGGAGAGGSFNGAGQAGATGTGAGGGSGGAGTGTSGGAGSGGGGGSGGYVYATIPGPASSYAYVVGAGGAAGTPAGTGAALGGAGGDGILIIEEHFQ